MLTIFSIPRAFEGHTAVIQRNAVESWRRLHPDVQIVLCADDPGVGALAHELDLEHVPNTRRTHLGTPYLDSAFSAVRRIARYPLLCYVNADIILMEDFVRTIRAVRFPEFMLVGRRWNVEITKRLDFEHVQWAQRLRDHVHQHGSRSNAWWIDYFVFPRDGELGELPPLVVGRPKWDNWFIWRARALRVPVIDATRAVFAVHQNHDYGHVPGGTSKQLGEGPEGDMNARVVGSKMCNLLNANYFLAGTRVWPALLPRHLIWRLATRIAPSQRRHLGWLLE